MADTTASTPASAPPPAAQPDTPQTQPSAVAPEAPIAAVAEPLSNTVVSNSETPRHSSGLLTNLVTSLAALVTTETAGGSQQQAGSPTAAQQEASPAAVPSPFIFAAPPAPPAAVPPPPVSLGIYVGVDASAPRPPAAPSQFGAPLPATPFTFGGPPFIAPPASTSSVFGSASTATFSSGFGSQPQATGAAFAPRSPPGEAPATFARAHGPSTGFTFGSASLQSSAPAGVYVGVPRFGDPAHYNTQQQQPSGFSFSSSSTAPPPATAFGTGSGAGNGSPFGVPPAAPSFSFSPQAQTTTSPPVFVLPPSTTSPQISNAHIQKVADLKSHAASLFDGLAHIGKAMECAERDAEKFRKEAEEARSKCSAAEAQVAALDEKLRAAEAREAAVKDKLQLLEATVRQLEGDVQPGTSEEELIALEKRLLGNVDRLRMAMQRERVSRQLRESVNKEFVCPITMLLMVEPVIAADGYSYERAAIEKWLRDKHTSPMTNLPLPHKGLTPNRAIKSAIASMLEATENQTPQGPHTNTP